MLSTSKSSIFDTLNLLLKNTVNILNFLTYEPRHKNTDFCICRNKGLCWP